jgi:hypothetical protein
LKEKYTDTPRSQPKEKDKSTAARRSQLIYTKRKVHYYTAESTDRKKSTASPRSQSQFPYNAEDSIQSSSKFTEHETEFLFRQYSDGFSDPSISVMYTL